MSDNQNNRLLQTWRQQHTDGDQERTAIGGGAMVSRSVSERSKQKSQQQYIFTNMRDIKTQNKIQTNQKDKCHLARDTTTTTITTAATTPSDRLLSIKKQEFNRLSGIVVNNRKSSLEPISSSSANNISTTPMINKTHSKTSAAWFNPYNSSIEDLNGLDVKKQDTLIKKSSETQIKKQNFIARNKSAAAVFNKARRESQKGQVNNASSSSCSYTQASARRRQNVHSAELAQKKRFQGIDEEERLKKMDEVDTGQIEERNEDDGYEGWLEEEQEQQDRKGQLLFENGERLGRGQLLQQQQGVGSWRGKTREGDDDIEENSVESDGDKQDDDKEKKQQSSQKKVDGLLVDKNDYDKSNKVSENSNKITTGVSVLGSFDPQKIVSIQEKIKETQLLISHLKLNTNSSILPKQQDHECLNDLNFGDTDTLCMENSKRKLDIAAQLADISQMKVVAEEDESQGYADAHDDTLLDFVAHFNGVSQGNQKKIMLQQQQQQQSQQSVMKLHQNSSYANIHGKNNSNNNSYQPIGSGQNIGNTNNNTKSNGAISKKIINTKSSSNNNSKSNNNNNQTIKKDIIQIPGKQQQQQQQQHSHNFPKQHQESPTPHSAVVSNKSNYPISPQTSTSTQQRQRMLRHRLSELAITLRSGSITMEDMREISWIVDMSSSFEGTLTPRQLLAFQRITEILPTTTSTKSKYIQRLSAPISIPGKHSEGQIKETTQKVVNKNIKDNELKLSTRDRKAQTSYDSVKWVQINNKKNNSKSINSSSSIQQLQQSQISQLTRRLRSTKSTADQANSSNNNTNSGLKSISYNPLKGTTQDGIVKNSSIRNTTTPTPTSSSQAKIRQSHQENDSITNTHPSSSVAIKKNTTNGCIQPFESHQSIKQDNHLTKQYLVPQTNQQEQHVQHYQQPQRKRDSNKITKYESESTNITQKKEQIQLKYQSTKESPQQPAKQMTSPIHENILLKPHATSALARVADIIHAQVNQKQQQQIIQHQSQKVKQKVSYADLHVLKQKSIKDEQQCDGQKPVMQMFLPDPPQLQITPVHSKRK